MKARHRSYAAIARGKIAKLPCEKCGNPDSQQHHDDYSKPLQVRFLCRECHLAEHAGEHEPIQPAQRHEVTWAYLALKHAPER